MKKGLKILCAALSLTAIMSFSAFAAETRKEYRAEAEPIRTEMKVMEEQMDALRESNKDFMEHFKNIHQNKTAARAVEPFCCGFSVLQNIFYWNSKVNFIYLPSDSQKVPLTSLQFFSA